MEEAEVFINSRPDIRTWIVLFENPDMERLRIFFGCTNIEDCQLVHTCESDDARRRFEWIRMDEAKGEFALPESFKMYGLYEEFSLPERWGLCVLNAETGAIRHLLEKKPICVTGNVPCGEEELFVMWDRSRDFLDSMNLKFYRNKKIPAVFDWKRESDTELSVILPVYNVEKYIEKCICSITAWDAGYVEYIFVSDGSTDGSVAIIKEYMKKDDRLRLIEKKNGGCASARQAGLDAAKGRYVGFVDPDDFTDENMYIKLFSAALSGSFDIALCGYNEYYEETEETKKAEDALWYPYIDGCFDPQKIKELITYSRVAIWRGIYRRDFLIENEIGFYTDLRRFDDLPFKVETFARSSSVVMVPEHLYYYRLGRKDQDVSANDERLFVHFDIFSHLDDSVGGIPDMWVLDNLQMCKLQTHRYALSKLLSEFKAEYKRRAKTDLEKLMDKRRTYLVAERMLGDEAVGAAREILE